MKKLFRFLGNLVALFLVILGLILFIQFIDEISRDYEAKRCTLINPK